MCEPWRGGQPRAARGRFEAGARPAPPARRAGATFRAAGGRGFTMIEILVVVALLALVAAFAIPKLDFSSYRVNGAARSLTAVLARAQRLAVTNQSNVNVLFDAAHNAVVLHEDLNNNNQMDTGEVVRRYPLGDGVVYGLGGAPALIYTPTPVSFAVGLNGLPELTFRRDGSASQNGTACLTSAAAVATPQPAYARCVEVVEATGRPSWYQYNGTAWVQRF